MTRLSLPVLAVLLAALLVPSSASAVGGTTTLVLDGPAGKRMAAAGMTISGGAGAAAFERRAVVPVTGGRLRSSTRVVHRGTLVLRTRPKGRAARSMTITGLEVRLGSTAWVTGLVGGRRRTILVSRGTTRPVYDVRAGKARLTRTSMRWAKGFAPRVRRALALRRIGPGAVGTLAVDAELPTGAAGTPGAGAGPGTGAGAPGAPGAAGPLAPASPSARPATAVDVVSATLGWHVRDSFIQYLEGGEGTRVAGGAVAGAPTVRPGSPAPLVYDFSPPFAGGWYDPATDTALLRFGGSVGFSYRAHQIDYDTHDGEIELRGAGSRATFRFTGRAGATFDGTRGTLVDLHPSQAVRAGLGPDGRTRILDEIPATVPADGASSVFAGFYFPGDPYGWMSVSFTPAG
jgi:hypothetical protein